MPIYVYERPDGSRFELRQGFNDSSLIEDPETGVPVRRIMQPAPVIFKGSGWYKTDSRAANHKDASTEATPTGEAAKTEGATAEAAKPDAKPDAKSDTKAETKTATPTKPTEGAKKAADKIASTPAAS